MPEGLSYEFPESVLNKAEKITLRDLLDNPATQCWLIRSSLATLVHMH